MIGFDHVKFFALCISDGVILCHVFVSWKTSDTLFLEKDQSWLNFRMAQVSNFDVIILFGLAVNPPDGVWPVSNNTVWASSSMDTWY